MKLREPPVMPENRALSLWLRELRNLINVDHSSVLTDIASLSTAIYFGEPANNGCWRIIRSGTKLHVERKESGGWVKKFAFTTT